MDPQDVTRTGHRWQSRSPALRFYRVLLRMVPASDREALGDDMEAVVVSNLAEQRRRHGRLGVAIAMGRAALDVVAFAISARTDDGGRVADGWPIPKERRMRNIAEFIRSVGQDLRFAIRLLRKEPAFAAILAVGVVAAGKLYGGSRGFVQQTKYLEARSPGCLLSQKSLIAVGVGRYTKHHLEPVILSGAQGGFIH